MNYMSDKEESMLITVPFRVIEYKDGVILKRGCTEVLLRGERIAEILQIILDISNQGVTKKNILESFPVTDRSTISYLVDELIKRHLLVHASDSSTINNAESEIDVFYSHFGKKTNDVTKVLNSKRIVIMGKNYISRQLVNTLYESGMKNIVLVDYSPLHSLHESDICFPQFNCTQLEFDDWNANLDSDCIDCIVVTSPFGGMESIRKWNKFCIEHNYVLMPVVLQDLIGYVGPIVIPYETACFECFLARRNSNIADFEIRNWIEIKNLEEKEIVGYQPAMAFILGDIAAMELVKFYSGCLPTFNVGKSIRVNMLSTQLESHKVLKIPRCKVCSSLNKQPAINLTKSVAREYETSR